MLCKHLERRFWGIKYVPVPYVESYSFDDMDALVRMNDNDTMIGGEWMGVK